MHLHAKRHQSMNFCVKILFCTLLSCAWANSTLSHSIVSHAEFDTITFNSTQPAHINPEGLLLNQKILNDQQIPLPHSINIRKKTSPQSITIYACLDTGQCIKPYTTQVAPLGPQINSTITSGAIAAVGTAFNPCFAPMWILVSSQITQSIIISSCVMGLLLTIYQLTLQYFGIALLAILHHYGLHELGLVLMASLAFTMLFPEKFSMPKFITHRATHLPSFVAIILSAGCLMPIQLGSIVALQLSQGATWLFASSFLLTSIMALMALAAFSRKAYTTCMNLFPPLFQILAMLFITYVAIYLLQSSWALSLLLCINLVILYHGQGWLHLSKGISSLIAISIAMWAPLQLAQTDTSEQMITTALANDGQKLYVTAEWCSQCRILKSQLKEKVIWMDITTSTPWKEKWVKDHNVDILPGCFVSENKKWIACKS